jgi:hypothetical protein
MNFTRQNGDRALRGVHFASHAYLLPPHCVRLFNFASRASRNDRKRYMFLTAAADACRDNRTAQRVGSMWTGLVKRIEHRQNIPKFFRILVQIVECIEKRKVFGA